jgi:hypothetical protein
MEPVPEPELEPAPMPPGPACVFGPPIGPLPSIDSVFIIAPAFRALRLRGGVELVQALRPMQKTTRTEQTRRTEIGFMAVVK